MRNLKPIKFTVASELLRELGERLVGRQYIALAELVKNSFDADASKVEIRIQNDWIEISDNGHGMSEYDFANRWMRVGSTHKVKEKLSPELKRPLTGSKGVGRLAAQFLAHELELTSVPKKSRLKNQSALCELYAMVDWDTAVQAGELTHAEALYELDQSPSAVFPLGNQHGTTITLRGLKHKWASEEFEALAREIWFLQPPFRSLRRVSKVDSSDFEVDFSSTDPKAVSLFKTQMSRILDLYTSRLVGKLSSVDKSQKKRKIQLSLELESQSATAYEYQVPIHGDGICLIDSLEFEIRIFTLKRRQPYGIPVQDAREYMADWGGVHIYDAGFRIPYAGPDSDWLKLEFDHSHRLTQSQLLPDELNVPMGLNYLPTNSRVLGIVNIDTSLEARDSNTKQPPSNQYLQIQVSRDRLVDNEAFRQLRDIVRYAIDYYATRLAVLRLQERQDQRAVGSPLSLIQNVWDVLGQHEDVIPQSVASQLRTELNRTIDSVREQSEWAKSQSGLLGAMATVGATAIAFDHQFNQQLNILESHITSLNNLINTTGDLKKSISVISDQIYKWIQDARDTRTIFSPITDERNRTTVSRFKARPLVESLSNNLRTFLRGVNVDLSRIDSDLLLPETSYPVWMAIFHNVFMNAFNAMLDSDVKQITVSSFKRGDRRGIRVHDTGIGIDLDMADELFKPLVRDLEISSERRALGYGGTGLGLAIVKMLATDLKGDVRFITPEAPFKTCFEIAWNEEQ